MKKSPAMLRVDRRKLQSTGELRMCVTGWRKRYQTLVPRQRLLAAAVLSCVVFAPTQSYSERTPNKDDCVVLELSALGKPGDTIARAREQVIDYLATWKCVLRMVPGS
jgi:hypothetical protein